MKKSILISVGIIIAAFVYLYVAHWYIYYRIGQAGLRTFAARQTYMMGQAERPKIIYAAIGDSLTAGAGVTDYRQSFPALVADKLAAEKNEQVELKDFSYPGYKTEDVINKLLPEAIVSQPNIITLLIGVNDIHNGVDVTKFKENYQLILDRLTAGTKAKIYVISLPLLGADSLLWPPYQYYFQQETIKYNQVIEALARTYNLPYIDIYTPTVDLFKKNGAHYSVDSFHPSAVGYQLWADIIYANINR